jgi:hypothetical protein
LLIWGAKGRIKRDIENSGFTKMAAILGIQSLTKKGLISNDEYPDYNDTYIGYQLTENGWNWVLDNQDRFEMKKPIQELPYIDPDEIPF